jgi:hypothetical protein
MAPLSGQREKKEVIEHKMCVLIFSITLSEIFLILIRTKRDTIQKLVFTKITCYSCAILRNFNFLDRFSINIKIHETEPSCSMRTDGQRDNRRLIVALRNSANAPKM